MRTLYLFPILYPYSRFGECFLEEELKYVAPYFAKIVVVPLRKEVSKQKSMPDNCSVVEPLMENKFKLILKALFNPSVAIKMIPEFFREKVYLDKVKLSIWAKGFAECNAIMNSSAIKKIGKSLSTDDVCYFYWGKWSNVLSLFWKGRCNMISRFHGMGDLWEDIYHEYFPLRKQVLKSLDRAVFISQKGERYFQQKYPGCKTMYSPLGSFSIGVPEKNYDGVVRIVSCSTIIPLKRIDLILRSLDLLTDMSIEWTHIGGAEVGLDIRFQELQEAVSKKKNDNLHVNLLGTLPHDKVMEYYGNHPFDLFINLSTSEGVPVSIMEALSCNISVVATDVGGTCEVVTPETGVLVSANPTEQEVANAVRKCVKLDLTPRSYWEKHFDAEVNYSKFALFLNELH